MTVEAGLMSSVKNESVDWRTFRLSGTRKCPASSVSASFSFQETNASWMTKPVFVCLAPAGFTLPRLPLSVWKKNVTSFATWPPTRRRARRAKRFWA